jgi:hypothetical protein
MRMDLSNRWRRATAQADRVLILALATVLATASASAGFTLAHPVVNTVRTVDVLEWMVKRVVVPVPPPTIDTSSASIDAARSELLAEHRCLAQAMYYEARSEGEVGEKAVAEVVLNRLSSGEYGHSICQVVFAGSQTAVCQFSFACDGSLLRPKEDEEWRKAEILAARILSRQLGLGNITENATFYHANYVKPSWASRLVRTAEIGNHIFYRPPGLPDELGAPQMRGSTW